MARKLKSKKTGVVWGWSQQMYDSGSYDIIEDPPKPKRRKRLAKPKAKAADTQPAKSTGEATNEQDDS